MAAVQIFLSTVSAEFETYREALRADLTRHNVSVAIQEDFIASGSATLEKLDDYIRGCDAVIHLVGDMTGAMAESPSVEVIRRRYPELPVHYPVLTRYLMPGGPQLSYTQWEAWLALWHGKVLLIAQPEVTAPRSARYAPNDEQRRQQAEHLARLAAVERYPEFRFANADRLAVASLRSSVLDLLVKVQAASGAAKPCDLPPAAGHFVGRADALVDLTTRLREGRHVTVVGGAGMGKTALAAAALRQLLGEGGERLLASPWPDGVLLLDLYVQRGMADPAWHALANRVKGADWLPDQSGPVRAAQALRDQRLLIVVEGAEQADGQDGRCALPDLQRPLGSACRWLVLTRLLSQADPAERIWLQERLTDAEAGDLLDQLVAEGGAPPLPEATVRRPVLALLQGHPLALTWAGKLLARGDEDPHWLLHEWRASHLPPLADPQQGRHTLAWLFDRSVSRLDDIARAVLSVAGCLAPTPVPLAAFAAALPNDEATLRAGLRSLVQHGLLRLSDDRTRWQFAHVLAYGHAREGLPAPASVPPALAEWVMQTLQAHFAQNDSASSPVGVAACLEHATALLKGDPGLALGDLLLEPLLYALQDRFLALGWSASAEAGLSAVQAGLDVAAADGDAALGIERERCILANREADLHLLRGDLKAAEQAYRSALAVSEQLAQADPSNAEWQRDLSVSQEKIGDVLSAQGDLAGAEKAYRLSLAVRERLAQADPSNAQWQRDLSISQNKIGDVLRAQGDLAGAEKAYRSALAVSERLAQADPSNAQWQRDLSISQNKIGDVLSAQGDLAGAEKAYRLSLAVSERLAQADPSNAQWQRDLSISQNRIGDVLSAQGDLAGAEKAYRSALAVAERLAQADPSNAQWQRDLSVSQNKIGEVLSAQGDLARAEKAYRSALAVAERLAQADPNNAPWQRDLFFALWWVAHLRDLQSDRAGALPVAQRALGLAQRLAALDPRNVTWQKDLSVGQALVQRLGG